MTLSPKHLRLALSCAYEELEARRRGKTPGVQSWISELIRALELELAVSPPRQNEEPARACLEHEQDDDEWIGTRQVAALLGWHERKVQRRVAELDGQKVSGALVFNATQIREYAAELNPIRMTRSYPE